MACESLERPPHSHQLLYVSVSSYVYRDSIVHLLAFFRCFEAVLEWDEVLERVSAMARVSNGRPKDEMEWMLGDVD